MATTRNRAAFGLIALELSKNDDNMIIVTGDVSTSAGLDRFENKILINI